MTDTRDPLELDPQFGTPKPLRPGERLADRAKIVQPRVVVPVSTRDGKPYLYDGHTMRRAFLKPPKGKAARRKWRAEQRRKKKGAAKDDQ